MAPSGLVKRANVSRSDVTIATVLPTYFCICGEYIVRSVHLEHSNGKYSRLTKPPCADLLALLPFPLQLVGNVIMDQLARRPIDKSFVLRNVTTERFGPKHIYKLNADGEKEAIYIQREQPNGTKAYEKVWRKKCPRCELTGESHKLAVDVGSWCRIADGFSTPTRHYSTIQPQSPTRRQIRGTRGWATSLSFSMEL